MVAVLILHGGSDVDWAMTLANELSEHAPVRIKLGRTPPKVTFGPSVVRVALWSEACRADGVDETLVTLLKAEPGHSVLVRRNTSAPAELDDASLAGDVGADSPQAAAEALRMAIPRVASDVAQVLQHRRAQADAELKKRNRGSNLVAFGVLIALLAAFAWIFNWGALRG